LEHTDKDNPGNRLDHRSYERQGVDKIPGVHMGVAASQMERKGIRTDRGNINRAVEITNKELRRLKARIRKCKDWIYSQPIENMPRMMEIMGRISGGKNLSAQWAKIADLKTQANVLMFLQNNNIADVEQLADKVTKINEEYYDISKKINAAERRMKTLNEHLSQYDNLKNSEAIYDEYRAVKPSKQEAFYNRHFEQIRLYQDAERYFDGVMNGRTKLPIKKWRSELDTLTAERVSLVEKYYSLRGEVRNVEVLRRGTQIMQEAPLEQTRARTRDHSL
jgi:cell division protein FtsB